MIERDRLPLTAILESIGHTRRAMGDHTLESYAAADWDTHALVERGLEIISEASRRLSADLKARHPEIKWPSVSGIGNRLRHNYDTIDPHILWYTVRDDLPPLEEMVHAELSQD